MIKRRRGENLSWDGVHEAAACTGKKDIKFDVLAGLR
jgi:hypothetical protein